MSKNQTVIIPIKCSKSHKKYYLRYDFSFDGVWVLSYGLKKLPTDGKYISEEQCENTIVDLTNYRCGPQYKCPYCGNTDYVRCGRCGKLTCWHSGSIFECAHCGNTGEVGDGLTKLEGKGGRTQL